MRLLDLFCCEGGAAKAYQDADAWTTRSSDLRAVLSAAPTDTTKETP